MRISSLGCGVRLDRSDEFCNIMKGIGWGLTESEKEA